MGRIGNYEINTFPKSRISTVDTCELGSKRHVITALIEIDVTDARKMIREIKKDGGDISFTSWIIKCISRVCSEYKLIHSVRKGKRKAVTFDDVDVSILVEREVKGEKVPLPFVLRATNEKSVSEICREIRAAQAQPIGGEGDYVLSGGPGAFSMKLYYALPGFIRRLFLRRIMKSPMLAKKNMGTVVVTSVGMMGRINGWVIPISMHPLTFAVGSIIKKPGVIDNAVAIREVLFVTVLVDHDVVDGAPAVRALSKLIHLLEKGAGLQDAGEFPDAE